MRQAPLLRGHPVGRELGADHLVFSGIGTVRNTPTDARPTRWPWLTGARQAPRQSSWPSTRVRSRSFNKPRACQRSVGPTVTLVEPC